MELKSCLIKSNPYISKWILYLIKKIEKEFFKKDNLYEEHINCYLQLIVLAILRYLETEQILNKHEKTIKLIEYAKELIKEKPNLNHHIIASNIGYSYDRFRHLFKEIVGITPKQYQLETRLVKAKDLLLNSNLSIKNIAEKCGFNSNISFTNFFTKRLGITPLKYRKLSLLSKEKDLINLDDK